VQNAPEELRASWNAYLERNPGTHIRDAAEALRVSEAELLATKCGESVVRLEASWPDLVGQLGRLGRVVALTRNHVAVSEKTGVYEAVSTSGHVGLVLGKEIDLRIFFEHWRYGFAVEYESRGALRRSLQFFDAGGASVQKVHMIPESNLAVYEELVSTYRSGNQSAAQPVARPAPRKNERPDAEVDVEGFREAWLRMRDTHEFFGLLRDFSVSRTQGLRLAPDGFAIPVRRDALLGLLEDVAAAGTGIMVFVRSPGAIQIHTGPVRSVKETHKYVNVLDPGFNLHVRAGLIASAWAVRKPTGDGLVTSVEFFDAEGRNVALIFGERKPGEPESQRWREHVEAIGKP